MRIKFVGYLTLLLLFLATSASAATSITPIVQTNAIEWGPAAGTGGIAWNHYSKTHPAVYADTGSGAFQVGPDSGMAWTGSIEGSILTFQRVDRWGASNIARYDLASMSNAPDPNHVNTKWWEYQPSASGDWVFFGRTNVNSGARREWRKLVLVNSTTGESRILTRGPRGATFGPDQVNGNWAVWHECPQGGCVVYLYDILADSTLQIPQVGHDQYDAAVAPDGTMYFLRSAAACGQNVRIIRREPSGVQTEIYAFPTGTDAGGLYLAQISAAQDLYFQQYTCASASDWDIYKIADAQTASAAVVMQEPVPTDVATMPMAPQNLTQQQRAQSIPT